MYLSVLLLSEGESGHSSIQVQNNAISRLSNVIVALQQHPLPLRWNPIIGDMFHYLLPTMSFSHRLVFANIWLTRPLIIYILSKEPTTKALISTTIVPTIIYGGIKENVLPASAKAIINFRLVPGDTIQDVLLYLHSISDRKHVKIFTYGEINHNPITAADLNSIGFHILTHTIQSVFSGTIVTPSIMIAGTDSRYYMPLTNNIFRFYPLIASKQDIEGVHGCNERIAVNSFLKSIDFYSTLILNSDRYKKN